VAMDQKDMSDAGTTGTQETIVVTDMTAVVDMTVTRVGMIVTTAMRVEVAGEVVNVTEDIAIDFDDKK